MVSDYSFIIVSMTGSVFSIFCLFEWVFNSRYMHRFFLLLIFDIFLILLNKRGSGNLNNLLYILFLDELLSLHIYGRHPQDLFVLQRHFLWQVGYVSAVYQLTLHLITIFDIAPQIIAIYHLGFGPNIRYNLSRIII